jgi:simple sugar transport system ATP-binding protein
MLGRELADHDPEVAQRWGIEAALDVAADELPRSVVLSADGVTSDAIAQPAQISLIEGELVGFAGLLGSGRSELARLITGVDALGSGRVVVDGQERALHSPHQAMALGLVYSSENRKSEGIIGELSVCDNIALALQAQQGWLRPLGAARKEELATSWIEALDIRPPDPHKLAGQLSGGNQQKVLLARLLALAPRILVLDEPTRGIDVGAKVEIQKLVSDLAGTGIAVVFISAELEEVLRVSQRILVLRDRRIVAELSAEDLTIGELLAEVAKAESDE